MYENHPELILSLAKLMSENNIKPEIEVFDLAMLYNAYNLMSKGIIKGPVHIQFVFGIYNALPASKDILIFELNEMKNYSAPDSFVFPQVNNLHKPISNNTLLSFSTNTTLLAPRLIDS